MLELLAFSTWRRPRAHFIPFHPRIYKVSSARCPWCSAQEPCSSFGHGLPTSHQSRTRPFGLGAGHSIMPGCKAALHRRDCGWIDWWPRFRAGIGRSSLGLQQLSSDIPRLPRRSSACPMLCLVPKIWARKTLLATRYWTNTPRNPENQRMPMLWVML